MSKEGELSMWSDAMAEHARLRRAVDALQIVIESKDAEIERLRAGVAGLEQDAESAFERGCLTEHNRAVAAEAEVERLRAWRRDVCDTLGYDSEDAQDGEEWAEEVREFLPAWRAEWTGLADWAAELENVEWRAEAAEAKVAQVEALAKFWISFGAGDVAMHWDKLGQVLRAALADPPAEKRAEGGA